MKRYLHVQIFGIFVSGLIVRESNSGYTARFMDGKTPVHLFFKKGSPEIRGVNTTPG